MTSMNRALLKLIFIYVLMILFAGCATNKMQDYSALAERQPRSIVVIPPINDSIEVNASYTFLSTISRPLAEKGYYVFPVAVIDLFMKENGLPTPAEMNAVSLEKIQENIGAEAILYVQIHDWGQKYEVISSTSIVSASLRLVDAKTGDLLWSAKAQARNSSNNSSSLTTALLSAVIDQISGSIVDHTYELSREANYRAINHPSRGLLEGPYRVSAEVIQQ